MCRCVLACGLLQMCTCLGLHACVCVSVSVMPDNVRKGQGASVHEFSDFFVTHHVIRPPCTGAMSPHFLQHTHTHTRRTRPCTGQAETYRVCGAQVFIRGHVETCCACIASCFPEHSTCSGPIRLGIHAYHSTARVRRTVSKASSLMSRLLSCNTSSSPFPPLPSDAAACEFLCRVLYTDQLYWYGTSQKFGKRSYSRARTEIPDPHLRLTQTHTRDRGGRRTRV